jgi:putative PIN family toxin of toxin-antitoxin system
VRAILDPNVIISAILSRGGRPAKVLRAWREGRFELLVSPLLLEELERALGYPKLARHISVEQSAALTEWLGREALLVADPETAPTVRAQDPGDDYLLALAEIERATLVTGDSHLLALSSELPVLTPREFLVIVGAS